MDMEENSSRRGLVPESGWVQQTCVWMDTGADRSRQAVRPTGVLGARSGVGSIWQRSITLTGVYHPGPDTGAGDAGDSCFLSRRETRLDEVGLLIGLR